MNCAGFELFNSEPRFFGSAAWGWGMALRPCPGFPETGPCYLQGKASEKVSSRAAIWPTSVSLLSETGGCQVSGSVETGVLEVK